MTTNSTRTHGAGSAGSPPPITLAGQAAAPEGPVDLTMMYVLHHAFRRDLAAFAAAAASTALGDRRAWARLAARWRLFAALLSHHHHGEDEGLWPLLERRTDADGRAVLQAMAAEHAEIDPLLEGCAAGLQRLAAGPDADARAALLVRVTAARESLGRHLAHEERDALALVQRLVTPEEWRRLDDEHFAARHLPVRTVLGLVPWAMHALPPAVQARVVADAPTALRVVWVLTRRQFGRTERRTFGGAAG